MFESVDRLMLAGLGALSMSREKAEKIFDEYVSRGQAEKSNKTGFVKEMMDSAEKSRQEFENIVAKQVRGTVTKLELARKEDVERLEKKVDELLKKQQS